tara:strand:+ start:2113 stop:2808 length:696 start_codon:yes stop_codon:yes gene_type:complete
MTYQIEEQYLTSTEKEARDELNNITTEQLDEIAKEFKPKVPYDEVWDQEFIKRCLAMAEMFEDGNEVIIKAKFQDQLPRMFEKMRDNVQEQAEKLKRHRQTLVRQDVGIEITGNKLEDCDEKINQFRQQWASLDYAFKALVYHFRPAIKGQTGIDFGKYTMLSEFAKVKRMQNRNQKLTIDTLLNNRPVFDDLMTDPETGKPMKRATIFTEDMMLDISNQDGIIELPEHLM